MSRRVVVTGGAGFLGSHMCERLLADGHEVTCVDNLVSGDAGNLDGCAGSGRFRFVHADVREPLGDLLAADAIFHLACPGSPVDHVRDPLFIIETCVLGTRSALALARRTGARVVVASTSEVYGDPQVHPQREDYEGRVDPTSLRACYQEGKRCGEAVAAAFARGHGVDVRIARIFNTYGPRLRPEDGRVVPTFVAQALAGDPITVHGDGRQTRSFCFVSDLVDGLVRLMEAPPPPGPVNLGQPDEIQIGALAERVRALCGAGGPVTLVDGRPGDPARRRPDIGRAEALLGWRPRVGLDEGLAATIAAARETAAAVRVSREAAR